MIFVFNPKFHFRGIASLLCMEICLTIHIELHINDRLKGNCYRVLDLTARCRVTSSYSNIPYLVPIPNVVLVTTVLFLRPLGDNQIVIEFNLDGQEVTFVVHGHSITNMVHVT